MWLDTEWKSKHPLLPKFIRVTVETGTIAGAVIYPSLRMLANKSATFI
jgi:hypothetical protein